tara:strand:- start:182 stop:1195 length:1014 start_codon:yes stop_codon:yes gene_type:complete
LKKKILITGGAGYIGSHSIVALFNNGFEPVIVDNFNNSDPWVLDQLELLTGQKTRTYKVDCTNYKALESVFKKEFFAGVIHFAALKAVGNSAKEPLKYYKNNIESLVNIIELMDKYKVPNFVFSSSCTVYGKVESLPIKENHPINTAESPYGSSKQMCELIIKDCLKSKKLINATVLRYFNPVGAHPSGLIGELPLGEPNNLAPYITETAAGIRSSLTIFGKDYKTTDGTCIRDYIHVMDLAEAHVKSIQKMELTAASYILNIGIGKGNSVLEVIKAFEKATNIKIKYSFGPRRKGDIAEIFADNQLAKETLNWEAKHSLEDAMRDAWRWQKYLSAK